MDVSLEIFQDGDVFLDHMFLIGKKNTFSSKRKVKEQNQEVKDMYTTERKEAMHSQVAELHHQKSSVTKTEQYSESKSSSQQIVTSFSTFSWAFLAASLSLFVFTNLLKTSREKSNPKRLMVKIYISWAVLLHML